jgi:hypothetical protein
VSAAEVERARTEASAQDATARKAAARLAELERGARSEDRSAVRDRLSAARARLDLAQANLERRHVSAPVAGTVLLSRYHVGEFFEVGPAPLFILGDMSRLRVRVEVDEIDVLRFETGAACSIYGDDNERITEGSVFRMAPRMGRRGLPVETPTARADIRVREVFVEVPCSASTTCAHGRQLDLPVGTRWFLTLSPDGEAASCRCSSFDPPSSPARAC